MDLKEISKPARPRRFSGLGGVTSGGSYSGPSATATPPQLDPTPLKPPYPSMSMAHFADDPGTRKFWKAPHMVQPPTSAPGEVAGEGGRKRKRMTESLVTFIAEMLKKKRAEGSWPGEKSYSGPQKELNPPEEAPKPKTDVPEPKFDNPDAGKERDPISDAMQGKGTMGDVIDQIKKIVPPGFREPRTRYPSNPPNPSPQTKGITRGNYHESSLIDSVLQLQEIQGGNLFEKAKKKVIEGVGYNKDTTQSVIQSNRPINKSDVGIGQTASLTYESGEKKKKRTEGGDEKETGPMPSGGHLSQMGGQTGETKNYGGPASSLGGNLNKILGGGAGGSSTSDKSLGGDAGGAAGAAAGAVAGASGGGESGGAAGAAGAATGSGGENQSTPVTGAKISDTKVMGGPAEPPRGPTSTRSEGGKKRGHSRK